MPGARSVFFQLAAARRVTLQVERGARERLPPDALLSGALVVEPQLRALSRREIQVALGMHRGEDLRHVGGHDTVAAGLGALVRNVSRPGVGAS